MRSILLPISRVKWNHYIKSVYQISIYVKMTMRRRTEALTASILKSFISSVLIFFKQILENKNLFQILGLTGSSIEGAYLTNFSLTDS